MAAVGDTGEKEELEKIFKNLFIVSKYLGLFPITLKHGKFKISPFLFGISVGVIGLWSTIIFNFADLKHSEEEHLLNKLSRLLPVFTLLTVLPCNLVWLSFSAKKLTYVLKVLNTLKINVSSSVSSLHKYTKLFLLAVLLVYVFECISGRGFPDRILTYTYLFMVLSTFLIADQFWSILLVLRKHYEYLCENLRLETAVEFTNTHDLLAKCCLEANECYSPQLLLIMVSVFVYIVSVLYTLIIKYLREGGTDYIQMSYLVMFVTTILHFLTGCRLTTLEAKRFDDLLYRLIIHDNTKSLMRNNRILLHFKAMKDLEFSAMEFFNFDYSLICSVVSTATTYIVILVQFAS